VRWKGGGNENFSLIKRAKEFRDSKSIGLFDNIKAHGGRAF